MSKAKPFRAWAVMDRDGDIFVSTTRNLKREVIADYASSIPNAWQMDRDRFGLKIVKVEVRQVSQ